MLPIRDHNPSVRVPYVTYLLMALNIGIWAYGALYITSIPAINQLYYDYAMIPARVSGGENLRALVTSVFLHAGFLHLAGNMLFLFIYGDNLEDKMGHIPFLVFYLACGIGAGLAQWAAAPWSAVATIGASGAIAGVMGGYLLLFPRAKIDIFIFLVIIIRIIPVSAWIVLGLWFGLQLVNSFTGSLEGGGVAYWAHAGGFVAGFILTIPVWFKNGGPAFWTQTQGHPPHPEARYEITQSTLPRVRRK